MISVIKAIFWVGLFILVAIFFPTILCVFVVAKFFFTHPHDWFFFCGVIPASIFWYGWFMACSAYACSKIDG